MNTTGVGFIKRTLLQILLLYSGPSIYVTFSRVVEDLDRVGKNAIKSRKNPFISELFKVKVKEHNMVMMNKFYSNCCTYRNIYKTYPSL